MRWFHQIAEALFGWRSQQPKTVEPPEPPKSGYLTAAQAEPPLENIRARALLRRAAAQRKALRELDRVAQPIVADPPGGVDPPGVTTDRNDPALHESRPDGQQKIYLVLPAVQRERPVRPLRFSYKHLRCGTVTTMGRAIAETFAADPRHYTATMCANCGAHFPLGRDADGIPNFIWADDGKEVGS